MAVVIVSHNTREHLRACLATVLAEAPREVVVVDNASSDGSVEMVESCYPGVLLRANKINRGYGAAANQAIAGCAAPYALLLNSDTLLEPGALGALSAYLDLHPRAAVVGPRLVTPDGRLEASCYPFPTPLNTLLELSALGRPVRLIRHVPVLRDRYVRTWPQTRARVVPWVKGAALAIRRDAFAAAGGFDESFFMYYEEADLCYRLRAAGWQVHFTPVATVVHVGGASTAKSRTEMAVQLLAGNVRFHDRHYSRARLAALNVVMKGIVLARLIIDSIRLPIARGASERAVLSQGLDAWRRVLLGRW